MNKLIKRTSNFLLAGLLMTILVGVTIVFSGNTPVFAQDQNALCDGVNITGPSGESGDGCGSEGYSQDGGGPNTIKGLIKTVLNIFSMVVGAISVIMIIIGGFKYITSGGDATSVGGAKNTILYAIVGLVIVFFAQVIVKFVIGNLVKESTN